jgi:hypothetical protein
MTTLLEYITHLDAPERKGKPCAGGKYYIAKSRSCRGETVAKHEGKALGGLGKSSLSAEKSKRLEELRAKKSGSEKKLRAIPGGGKSAEGKASLSMIKGGKPPTMFEAKLKKGDLEGAINQILHETDKAKEEAQSTKAKLKRSQREVERMGQRAIEKHPLIGENPKPQAPGKVVEFKKRKDATPGSLLEYLDSQECGNSHIPDGHKCHSGSEGVLKRVFRGFAGNSGESMESHRENGLEGLHESLANAKQEYFQTKDPKHKQKVKNHFEAIRKLQAMAPEEFSDRLSAANKRHKSINTKLSAQRHVKREMKRHANAISLLKSAGVSTEEFERKQAERNQKLRQIKLKPVRSDSTRGSLLEYLMGAR